MNNIYFMMPTLNDYSHIKSIWENAETMESVGSIYPISKEEYSIWLDNMTIKHCDKNCYYLIMKNDICVGEVSFHRFNINLKSAELNIKVKAEFRGNGIGRKALDHILSIFFNDWNGNEIIDLVRKDNRAGIAALKAYGFQERLSEDNNLLLYLNIEEFHKNKRFSI